MIEKLNLLCCQHFRNSGVPVLPCGSEKRRLLRCIQCSYNTVPSLPKLLTISSMQKYRTNCTIPYQPFIYKGFDWYGIFG